MGELLWALGIVLVIAALGGWAGWWLRGRFDLW